MCLAFPMLGWAGLQISAARARGEFFIFYFFGNGMAYHCQKNKKWPPANRLRALTPTHRSPAACLTSPHGGELRAEKFADHGFFDPHRQDHTASNYVLSFATIRAGSKDTSVFGLRSSAPIVLASSNSCEGSSEVKIQVPSGPNKRAY